MILRSRLLTSTMLTTPLSHARVDVAFDLAWRIQGPIGSSMGPR